MELVEPEVGLDLLEFVELVPELRRLPCRPFGWLGFASVDVPCPEFAPAEFELCDFEPADFELA